MSMSSEKISVNLLSNIGTGFSGPTEVNKGTTLRQLFDAQRQGENPSNYVITVNRQAQNSDYVLQADDRVSITPVKITGQILARKTAPVKSWFQKIRAFFGFGG